ncbi:peptidase [Actinoplanes sp. NPDC049802]|uniref:peptidase n=1 Tax=Actinoplanes sp. NPDC049802 TaxID=3154742 RepID=UPI0033FA1C98
MRALPALAALGFIMLPTPAFADPSEDPKPAAGIHTAGTSFLTAVTIAAGQPVNVAAVTGDYLYWSFPAEAGQRPELAVSVDLPKSGDRTGAQSWTVEVFDGLRRRQACVGGEQSPVAAVSDTELTLGCRLRQVRSWAEPWDGDPLPGTYYVRLSSTDLPEKDLGLPIDVKLSLTAPTGDTGADQGELAAPLVPDNQPGEVLTATPAVEQVEESEDSQFYISADWLPDFSSRWVWTVTGGVIAAITGLIGFSWTRRRRA